MYHVSAQGVDERMINVHYYIIIIYWPLGCMRGRTCVWSLDELNDG